MSYIKKEDALAAVMSVWKDADYDAHPLSETYDRITRLPVFESYQKKGIWIELDARACNGDLLTVCSSCRRTFREEKQLGMVRRVCPNCGAEMADLSDINDGKTATAEFYAEVERETALLMREEAKE